MMAPKYTRLLGIVALTAVAGCASGAASLTPGDSGLRGDTANPAAPSTLQNRILSCRNRGVYNRAADLCVSEGP